MYLPRAWGGRYSDSIEGSMTSIPPRPIPANRRRVNRLAVLKDRAVSPVKIE